MIDSIALYQKTGDVHSTFVWYVGQRLRWCANIIPARASLSCFLGMNLYLYIEAYIHSVLSYCKVFWHQILQGILTSDITRHSDLRYYKILMISDITRHSDIRYHKAFCLQIYHKAFWPQILQGNNDLRSYKAFWPQILQGIPTSDIIRH